MLGPERNALLDAAGVVAVLVLGVGVWGATAPSHIAFLVLYLIVSLPVAWFVEALQRAR